MQSLVFYTGLAIFSFYIGKVDKKIKVGAMCVAVPFAFLTLVGLILTSVLFFKITILVVGLLLFLLKKVKFIIGVKLAALAAAAAAAAMGVFTGPPGWIVMIICLLVIGAILNSLVKTVKELYQGIFELLSKVLLFVRKTCDAARSKLPGALKHIVLLVEIPVVCYLGIKAVWDLMETIAPFDHLSKLEFTFRVVALIWFATFLYRSYLKDTTLHGSPNDGIDIPGDDPSSIVISHIVP